jgi:hypothetical protein
MFKTLLIALLLLGCNQKEKFDDKYRKAFEYIYSTDSMKFKLTDSLKNFQSFKISVYDSVVPMDISNFFENLAKENKIEGKDNMKLLLDSLIAMDKAIWFQPIFVDGLSKLSRDKTTEFILFFSKPSKNILLAELFPFYESRRTYEDIQRFNRSVLYLFYFGPENQIEKVMATFPQYD